MKKLKTGLYGSGGYGQTILRCLTGLPDLYEARILPRGSAIPPDLDLVAIATPSHTHFDHIRKTLDAGKLCFVEKPMVNTAKEVRALLDLPESVRRTIHVGHNVRRRDLFRRLKQLLSEQSLGTLVHVQLNFSHGGIYGVATDNWRHSATLHREGALNTSGIHYLDLLHALFGPVRHVYALLGNYARQSEAFDANLVTGELDNGQGTTFSLQANYCQPSEKTLVVTGTDGILSVEREDIYLRMGRDQNKVPSERTLVYSERRNDTVREQFVDLHRSITEGTRFETGFPEGAQAVLLLEAAYVSHVEKRRIELSEFPEYKSLA
jgi:predicted dehydrogenase